MNYSSVMKRNEMPIGGTTWIIYENIIEVIEGRHKGPHVFLFHLYERSKIGKWIETENILLVVRGWSGGEGEV